MAGAAIAEHIQQDRAAIDWVDQLVGAIGIADLIDEGATGIGIGASWQGEIGAGAAAEILKDEGDTTGEQTGVAEQALQSCRVLVWGGLQPNGI